MGDTRKEEAHRISPRGCTIHGIRCSATGVCTTARMELHTDVCTEWTQEFIQKRAVEYADTMASECTQHEQQRFGRRGHVSVRRVGTNDVGEEVM